jgi:hypothetical protein
MPEYAICLRMYAGDSLQEFIKLPFWEHRSAPVLTWMVFSLATPGLIEQNYRSNKLQFAYEKQRFSKAFA